MAPCCFPFFACHPICLTRICAPFSDVAIFFTSTICIRLTDEISIALSCKHARTLSHDVQKTSRRGRMGSSQRCYSRPVHQSGQVAKRSHGSHGYSRLQKNASTCQSIDHLNRLTSTANRNLNAHSRHGELRRTSAETNGRSLWRGSRSEKLGTSSQMSKFVVCWYQDPESKNRGGTMSLQRTIALHPVRGRSEHITTAIRYMLN
jgi:hypothetical protein